MENDVDPILMKLLKILAGYFMLYFIHFVYTLKLFFI